MTPSLAAPSPEGTLQSLTALIESVVRAIREARDNDGELIPWSPGGFWMHVAASDFMASAALRAVADAGFVIVPKEPTDGLLMSMAIRYDHALGMPGYYDQKIMGCHDGISHAQRLSGALTTMRQLHEEVVGGGFYSADKEDSYRAAIAAALKDMGAG